MKAHVSVMESPSRSMVSVNGCVRRSPQLASRSNASPMGYEQIAQTKAPGLGSKMRLMPDFGVSSSKSLVTLGWKPYRAKSSVLEGFGGLQNVQDFKQASTRRRRKEVTALGMVGVSLSLTSGASAAAVVGPESNIPFKDTVADPGMTLNEEEISDVSLGTFYVFDKENAGAARGQFAQRGCGGCRGCRGCRRGCGGGGCGGCRRGCGGGGCGGCGGCGCCLSWGSCRIC